MILFFSATGNCRHTAVRIAAKTGDRLLDIAEMMKEKHFRIAPADGENIGMVIPVYDWILPSIVDEFLGKLAIDAPGGSHYVFLIVTFGTTPGCTASLADRYMREKGFPFRAFYTVQMPDTWTPVFDLSDPDKVRELNEKADKQIDEIITKIADRQPGDFSRRRLPGFVAGPAKLNYERVRKTSHFHVTDDCVGCAVCADNCPIRAIEIKDGRPAWLKEKCVMCLRCLHRCPKFAIQYGRRTKRHGQYVHP
jgi:ferredoxin